MLYLLRDSIQFGVCCALLETLLVHQCSVYMEVNYSLVCCTWFVRGVLNGLYISAVFTGKPSGKMMEVHFSLVCIQLYMVCTWFVHGVS